MATLVTKTVKPGGGGDYTDLDTALSTEAKDITLATGTDNILRFDCYPGEDARVAVNSADGWVTSADNYVELRFVDAGGTPAYTAEWDTNLYRINNDNGVQIQCFRNAGIAHLWHTAGTFQMRVGNISSTADHDGAIEFKNDLAAGFQRFDGGGIIVIDSDEAGSHVKGVKVDSDTPVRFRNWIVYGGETSQPGDGTVGFQIKEFASGPFELDSCTLDDLTVAVDILPTYAVDVRMRNCRATNIASLVVYTNGSDLAADSDNNLTDEATAPTNWGTNSIAGATVDYVDATTTPLVNRDYRLASSIDDGYETGGDLSADFTIDIQGTTRTTPWDIGPHELSSGSGPAAPSGVTVSNPTTDSLRVDWTDNTGGLEDHRVYFRKSGVGASYSRFSTVTAGTTTETVTGLESGTAYDIAVASYDGTTESPKVADTGTTTAESPLPPGDVTVTSFTDTTATLEWFDPNNGTANPRMYQRETGVSAWTFVTQLGTSATNYQFTGLSTATQYDLGVSYV